MEFCGWRKAIAVTVLVAFIGIGITWAMEQSSPQFQEKAGTPVVKKHHKFPWLIILLGTAAVGVGVYFLTVKKNDTDPVIQDEVYTIRYWNHMMASPQKTITKTLKPGTAYQASVSESGLSNVSQLYIAARYPDMGDLLGFGQNGTVNVNTASGKNTIDAYCFDTTHIDDTLLGKIAGMSRLIVNGRNSRWYRRDFNGQSSDYQNLWDAAFQQVDAALQNPFPVGSCSAFGGVSGTDFSYGYGNVGGGWGDKSYNDKYIITDLKAIIAMDKGLIFAQEVNIEELLEGIPGLGNFGEVNSKDVICSNGRLIEPGISGLRYAMIITQ